MLQCRTFFNCGDVQIKNPFFLLQTTKTDPQVKFWFRPKNTSLSKLLEIRTFDVFYCSNFKFDVQVRWFVFLRNLNSIKLEIIEMFEPKLCKFVSKFKLKLEKYIFLELVMCSNSKLQFWWIFDFHKCQNLNFVQSEQVQFGILPLYFWEAKIHNFEKFDNQMQLSKV